MGPSDMQWSAKSGSRAPIHIGVSPLNMRCTHRSVLRRAESFQSAHTERFAHIVPQEHHVRLRSRALLEEDVSQRGRDRRAGEIPIAGVIAAAVEKLRDARAVKRTA